MENLNLLESEILNRIAVKYPYIKDHLQFIKVNNREYTGVGMYTNFIYTPSYIEIQNIETVHLSTNETVMMDGLKYGLAFEVAITNGRLDFIELVTYDNEEWNGHIGNFHFVDAFYSLKA